MRTRYAPDVATKAEAFAAAADHLEPYDGPFRYRCNRCGLTRQRYVRCNAVLNGDSPIVPCPDGDGWGGGCGGDMVSFPRERRTS